MSNTILNETHQLSNTNPTIDYIQKSHFTSLSCFASFRSSRSNRFAFFRSFASLILFPGLALSLLSFHYHFSCIRSVKTLFKKLFSKVSKHAAIAAAIFIVVIF